jgi:sialic acid synthase SpsE
VNKIFFIAEAGSNWHIGNNEKENFRQAQTLIEIAKEVGADACKFQVFEDDVYAPNAGQYGDHGDINKLFKELSLPKAWLPELKSYCDRCSIEFMASVFSVADAKAVDPYVKRHKVASYECNHMELLEYLNTTDKEIYVSTGAATEEEALLASLAIDRCTLMHCVACYPAPIDQLNLGAIKHLQNMAPTGYSDHSEFNLLVPTIVASMGIEVYEKHFTTNNSLSGPDHKFALTPNELRKTIETIRDVESMIDETDGKVILPCELPLRKFAVRYIQAKKGIKAGDELKLNENYACLRPGNNPSGDDAQWTDWLDGMIANRDFKAGEGIKIEDAKEQ